jgi:hypothetical protein
LAAVGFFWYRLIEKITDPEAAITTMITTANIAVTVKGSSYHAKPCHPRILIVHRVYIN